MTDERTFTWPGRPRGQGRPRFVRATGMAYKAPDDKAFEQELLQAYQARHGAKPPLAGPFAIDIVAIYPPPKRLARALPTVKPDLDNICKSVLDALSGTAYTDDKNNVTLEARKVYGKEPGIRVTLRGVEEEAEHG